MKALGLTSVLGIGILLVVFILIKKQSLIEFVGNNHFIVQKLSDNDWFENKWLSGLFLFVLNAFLFSAAVGVIFLTGTLNIPYIHIVIMFAATVISIYLWIAIRITGEKTKKDQLIMGLLGSSFYMIFFSVFLYMFVTLEPSTPNHDTFMAAIGLMFGMIIAFVAWITCFLITGFAKNGKRQGTS